MAITWKNVNGPALPDAGKLMDSAVASFARAGAGLQNEVGKYEQQRQDVLDRGREAGVNAVMMKLNEISSPEQYAEMEKTGQFKAMMAGLDPRDQAALMQAPDARLQNLLQRRDQDYLRTQNDQIRADEPGLLEVQRMLLDGTHPDAARQNAEFLSPKGQVAALTGIRAFEKTQLTDAIAKRTLAHQEALRPGQEKLQLGALDLQTQQHADVVAQNAITSKMQAAALKYKKTPGNDTQAADAAIATLEKEGVAPKYLEFAKTLRPYFDTRPTEVVGKEKEAQDLGIAAIQKKDAEAKATNSMFITNANLLDRLGDLNKQLKGMGRSDEEIATINEVLQEELNTSKDPVNINALIQSATTAKSFLESPLTPRIGSGDWWYNFKANVQSNYSDIKKSPAYTKQLQQYIQWQGDNPKAMEKVLKDSLRKK